MIRGCPYLKNSISFNNQIKLPCFRRDDEAVNRDVFIHQRVILDHVHAVGNTFLNGTEAFQPVVKVDP